MQNLLYFFILSGFLFIVNFKYFFNSWCCILDYFILNCELWDKFLISMITLFLIIFYILILYRNFELIFEFMALKRAPYVAETFAFLSFCAFLNLIIILIKENKKKLTLCQNNEKWTKILWIWVNTIIDMLSNMSLWKKIIILRGHLIHWKLICPVKARLLQGTKLVSHSPSVPLTPTFSVNATLWLKRQPIHCLLWKPTLPIVVVVGALHKILFNNNAIFYCTFQNSFWLNLIRSYDKNLYWILINHYKKSLIILIFLYLMNDS